MTTVIGMEVTEVIMWLKMKRPIKVKRTTDVKIMIEARTAIARSKAVKHQVVLAVPILVAQSALYNRCKYQGRIPQKKTRAQAAQPAPMENPLHQFRLNVFATIYTFGRDVLGTHGYNDENLRAANRAATTTIIGGFMGHRYGANPSRYVYRELLESFLSSAKLETLTDTAQWPA